MRGLDGKVVVVAGGAGGIGSATSIRLGEEGASVVVGDLDGAAAAAVAKEIEARGGRALALGFDISEPASVAELLSAAVTEFGHIDALHANAADLSRRTIMEDSDVVEIDLDVYDRTMHVNARGHLLCARQVIPLLLDHGGGALVFTMSAAAFVGEPTRPAYAMAKAALGGLVRHIASKWGKEGIRANAVAPGLVLTETARAGIDSSFRDYALQSTRSPRLGTPEDIAAMVSFLVSEDASWINGQVISVDGGALLR